MFTNVIKEEVVESSNMDLLILEHSVEAQNNINTLMLLESTLSNNVVQASVVGDSVVIKECAEILHEAEKNFFKKMVDKILELIGKMRKMVANRMREYRHNRDVNSYVKKGERLSKDDYDELEKVEQQISDADKKYRSDMRDVENKISDMRQHAIAAHLNNTAPVNNIKFSTPISTMKEGLSKIKKLEEESKQITKDNLKTINKLTKQRDIIISRKK